MNAVKMIFLSIASLPVFSRIWGRIVRTRFPRFLVKRIIRKYRKAYGIDMEQYRGEPDDYRSLVEFFIRPLDPAVRPLRTEKTALVSPADGRLTEVETVFEDKATQVKGSTYALSRLLMQELDYSRGWHVAVVYLSPSDYHRYHYPLAGTVERYFHTGGRLFPVNQTGVNTVKGLFVRNERVITEMKVRGLPCYIVAVGATFVGSIKMEFIENPRLRKQWVPVNREVSQLEEMGRFEMGSTLVLVLPRQLADVIDEVKGTPVQVGQPIFRLKS